jgi:anti-anti-sigma factor
MDIEIREHKRANVLRVTGRVDASVAAKFEESLQSQIEGGATHVILEMDGTDYISSAGVRALIALRRRSSRRAGPSFWRNPRCASKRSSKWPGLTRSSACSPTPKPRWDPCDC